MAELILYKNKLKKKIRALADTLNVLNLYLEPPVEWYKQDVGEDFFFSGLENITFCFVFFFIGGYRSNVENKEVRTTKLFSLTNLHTQQ